MAGDHPHRLTRYLRNLVAGPQTRDAPDRELMEQFVAGRDDAALPAPVRRPGPRARRQGPMVYPLCRRVLRHEQDAEDAFQATFLVLARKAHTLRSPEAVGNWLYGVAYRTALKARTAAARRARQEAAAPVRRVAEPLAELTVHEAQTLVDQGPAPPAGKGRGAGGAVLPGRAAPGRSRPAAGLAPPAPQEPAGTGPGAAPQPPGPARDDAHGRPVCGGHARQHRPGPPGPCP